MVRRALNNHIIIGTFLPIIILIISLAEKSCAAGNGAEAAGSGTGLTTIAAAFIGAMGLIIGAFVTHRLTTRNQKTQWEKERAEKHHESVKKTTELIRKIETAEERYRAFLEEEHKFLRLTGFETRLRVSVSLDDVYVALRAREAGFGRIEGKNIELDNGQEIDGSEERLSGTCDIYGALKRARKKKADGLIILGDPGSGKTTLLKKMVLELVRKQGVQIGLSEDVLPIFIPLRDVKDREKGFSEFIRDYYGSTDLKLEEDFFFDHLDGGRCVVLLDGLDEVASEEERLEVCRWIERARAAFRKNLFVVTSRFAGYRGKVKITGRFLEMDVQPFQQEQVEQFLQKWYEAVEVALEGDTKTSRSRGKKSAGDLYKKIMGNERIRNLADNPLMLQIIALVHKDKGTLPERRVKFYEECTNVLLQNWDEAKGLEISLKAEESRRFLQPLAYWMHGEMDRTRASKKEVIEVIKGRAREAGISEEQLPKMLDNIRDRSTIFTGFDVDSYGFSHLSFQEYLTAAEIKSRIAGDPDAIDILVEHFDEPWWREVALLSMGLADPCLFEPLMNRLVKTDKFSIHYDFVLKCVADAFEKVEGPFIRLAEDGEKEREERVRAIGILQRIGGDRSRESLTKLLDDGEATVRAQAARGLKELGVAVKAEQLEAVGEEVLVNEKDGSELVLVPEGKFVMGDNESEYDSEKPEHTVDLDAYYISRYPVTNEQYRKFIDETDHRKPNYWDDKRFNQPKQPVVGVSRHDAAAYSKWAGLRLPTEAEWEKAARGTDKRKYPWGIDDPDERKCNYNYNVGQTTDAGAYPEGVSPYGIYDMAGNVWEWCEDYFQDDFYKTSLERNPLCDEGKYRVLRGGSWSNIQDYVRCACRHWFNPDYRDFYIGFRCARTFQ